MKIANITISTIFIITIQSCTLKNKKQDFFGFWECPHPNDNNKKFYFQIIRKNDSVKAKGFLTVNKFYNYDFKIDSLQLKKDSISFYIPGWNCSYSGKMSTQSLIKGGFKCENEPFDTVDLIINKKIKKYLSEVKAGCKNEGYKYQYQKPDLIDENISVSKFSTNNDSIFIYSIIKEIINNKYGRLNSFLLLKNNKLICEEYFYGYKRNDLHQIESSTKSIASLLIGIAKDRGIINDINEPIFKIFSEYEHLKTGSYKKITLSGILSMSSGFSRI